jgi:hypothetical protein
VSELKDRALLALRATTEPLYALVTELDAAIVEGERELTELRELRRSTKAVLRTLDPPPKPEPKPTNEKLAASTRERHKRERLEKKNRVLGFLSAYGPLQDITANDLLNGAGLNTDDQPVIGRALMSELLTELRNDGFLRLDRQAQGGQAVYRRVAL